MDLYPKSKTLADVINELVSRIEKLESLVSKEK